MKQRVCDYNLNQWNELSTSEQAEYLNKSNGVLPLNAAVESGLNQLNLNPEYSSMFPSFEN